VPEALSRWLTTSGYPEAETVAFRALAALALGWVVAFLFRISLGRRRGAEAHVLATTLVLLSVLIALVTVVIGENLARAFGLVGALSIVRFRTVVEDTRDTAFVIFAVVVGMAVGAGYAMGAVIAIPAVALGLAITGWNGGNGAAKSRLTVRTMLGAHPETLLGPTLDKHCAARTLTSVGTAKQGAALEIEFRVRLRSEPAALACVDELNRLEGVQGVELKDP
jgi:hypothetical protein